MDEHKVEEEEKQEALHSDSLNVVYLLSAILTDILVAVERH